MEKYLPDYTYYKEIFKTTPKPFAFVDMDLFNKNSEDIIKRAKDKKIRIVSKSIRCLDLIKKILASNSIYQGVMCYSPIEAVFMSEQGLDDLLVAYPFYSEPQVTAVCKEIKKGKTIIAMVDLPEHLERLNAVAKQENCILPVCMDIDMSSDYGSLHFGVRRSKVSSLEKAMELFHKIKECKNLHLDGVMGYESQIAGLGDKSASAINDLIIPILKKKSIKEIAKRRTDIVNEIQKQGHKLRFVNGGGTGSIESTIQEDCVTEVAVGSGFYSPGLFDNYNNFRHLPAAVYAIEITRNPLPNIYTCYGGGYTASGPLEGKMPKPYLPQGAKLLDREGAGEVQTPIDYSGPEKLKLGDPIFMRHSKAGELCERFNSLFLVSDGKIMEEVKTYRGEGKCF